MPGPVDTRVVQGSTVDAMVVCRWIDRLLEIFGSQVKLGEALHERFGGPKVVSWVKWVDRARSRDFIQARKAEQLWILLKEHVDDVDEEWCENVVYCQPVWKIVRLMPDQTIRHYYNVSPGKARRNIERFKEDGSLIEVAYSEGPWNVVDEVPTLEEWRMKRSSGPKGRPPYGYRMTPRGEREPDPEQQKVVRRIMELWREGHTYYRITKILDEEGVPPPEADAWNRHTVQRIIERETDPSNDG